MLKIIIMFFHKLLNPVNFIQIRINKIVTEDCRINGLAVLINKGYCKIGKGCIINSSGFRNIIGGDTRFRLNVTKNGKLNIGSNFRCSNSTIVCENNIIIGDNVMIGGGCKIWDTDFHPLDPAQRILSPNNNFKTKPIIIGNNVFIGGSSIILKGITIGDNSVVGAGSVVRSNIPPNQIWAGNPAVFLKEI